MDDARKGHSRYWFRGLKRSGREVGVVQKPLLQVFIRPDDYGKVDAAFSDQVVL